MRRRLPLILLLLVSAPACAPTYDGFRRVEEIPELKAQLPNAWLHVLVGCKHALPSQARRQCAREIKTFIENRGEGRSRVVDDVCFMNAP